MQDTVRLASVRKVWKGGLFKKDHEVLNSISVEIEFGSFITLCGPNGGGKTTLLKVIGGLVFPSSGVVENPFIKDSMGYLPETLRLSLGLCVRQLCEFYEARFSLRPESLFFRDLIQEYDQQRLSRLSYGSLRKVLWYLTVISDPQLLLLDEPFLGVDSAARKAYLEYLKAVKGKKTVVLITHDSDVIAELHSARWQLKGGSLEVEQ